MKLGCCGAIAALKCSNGTMATTLEEIAAELKSHWGDVFSAMPIDNTLLARWKKNSRTAIFALYFRASTTRRLLTLGMP